MEVIVDIESDPEAFTELARKNFQLPQNWGFCEIFGFEPDLLAMIPKPCVGVLLLFDCNCKPLLEINKKAMKKANKSKEKSQAAWKDLFFVNQLVGRSCGGLGVLHLMANALPAIGLDKDAASTVPSFVHAHSQASPKERGVAYVALAKSEKLNYMAASSAQHVDFTVPTLDSHDKSAHPHFIAFLPHKGGLWELDPSMAMPFFHGECNEDNFLEKTVRVIQEKFIASNPNSTCLCMMALVKQD